MLYDDANQVDVRYVISLAHHDVSIHGDEAEIPEALLWAKRNAICLSRRLDSLGELGGPTPPFYLFSENQSEKEDFYHAMLQNQARIWTSSDRPPVPQEFDVKHIVTLVQRLHSSEEQLQTRWINAILGRLFLALYRTQEVEEFLRVKISKKISRVNRPNYISKIALHKIDLGEGAPLFTNPRLKDLTADGNCCVEADLQYTGNFRIEISATVRIDLGPRFKAREVDILLAVVLKNLEGHLLVRFKPPPSNRFWMSFETMPKMSMDIKPIVSAKQVTFTPILRTIESKIREMVAESLVLPFWDDVPFLDTEGQRFRGGIWKRETPEDGGDMEIPDESEESSVTSKTPNEDSLEALKTKDDRTMSMPVLPDPTSPSLKPRRVPKPKPLPPDLQKSQSSGISTGLATGVERSDSSPVPRAIRSQTFSNAAGPVVTPDNANQAAREDKKHEKKNSATSAMIEISNRSPPASPQGTPSSSPPTTEITMRQKTAHSRTSSVAESFEGPSFNHDNVIQSPSPRFDGNPLSTTRSSRGSSTSSLTSDQPHRRSTLETLTKTFASLDEKSGNTNLAAATAAAKKWGWSVFGKGDQNSTTPETNRSPVGTPEQPIGRGHPHLPPGAPLPRPDRYALKRNPNAGTLPKRKPVAPPTSSEHPSTTSSRSVPPPPLPLRKPTIPGASFDSNHDHVLVVEAPHDSNPNSPVVGELDLGETPHYKASARNTPSTGEKPAPESTWKDEEVSGIQPLQSESSAPLTSASSSHDALPLKEQVEVS